ncbi:hypothetical protein ACXHXG_13440 [Rhizobium sp. LEGMi198b]
MSDIATEPQIFFDLVENLVQVNRHLTVLQGALLVACALDIASDSRAFSKRLGVEHALVLRDLNVLDANDGPLVIAKRDPRTLRSHFHLTANGRAMLSSACRIRISGKA